MYYITPKNIVDKRLGNNKIPKWDYAIMCFHGKEKSQLVVDAMNAKPLNYKVVYKLEAEDIFEATVNGKTIGVLRWCTGGAPTVANIVEELIYIGVKYIIGYGAAASITENVKKGEQIVAYDAALTDGTSKIYSDKNIISADSYLLNKLKDVSNLLNIPIRPCRGATIDAFYRQSDKYLDNFRKIGCEILNWEISPLYTITHLYNIPSIWIGHISDREVKNSKWDDWFTDREIMHKFSIDILLNYINILTKEVKL